MFQRRCVAFIDILGFKQLVADAEQHQDGLDRLLWLKAVLEDHTKLDNLSLAPTVLEKYKPRYIFISDSIILSSEDDDVGRGAVIAKCIQIANKLLEIGFLVRGGIANGLLWHGGTNLIGTSYIEAVKLEAEQKRPRITLTPSMLAAFHASPLTVSNMLVKDKDGAPYCNVLHPDYIADNHISGRIEEYYGLVRTHIIHNLGTLEPGSSPHGYWQVAQIYFNVAIAMFGRLELKI